LITLEADSLALYNALHSLSVLIEVNIKN